MMKHKGPSSEPWGTSYLKFSSSLQVSCTYCVHVAYVEVQGMNLSEGLITIVLLSPFRQMQIYNIGYSLTEIKPLIFHIGKL
jgi:hypothetical protein